MGLSPHSGSRDLSDPDVAIKAYEDSCEDESNTDRLKTMYVWADEEWNKVEKVGSMKTAMNKYVMGTTITADEHIEITRIITKYYNKHEHNKDTDE